MKILFEKGKVVFVHLGCVVIAAVGHSSAQLPEDEAFVSIVESMERTRLKSAPRWNRR